MSSPSLIIKEYVFHVEGMEESVKARIMRDIEPLSGMGEYWWDISHLWKTSGGVYSPSNRHGKTIESVESLMMAYARSFTVENGYIKNTGY